MIRIYNKEERLFDHLGLGSLDESIAAVVVEELNGSYEMEMEYPITGRHFDKIQLKNIIFCKPNMYANEQPFRIYSMSKPLEGIITINAEHISYDTSGVTILPKRVAGEIISFGTITKVDDKDGYKLSTILIDINNASAIQDKNYFTLSKGDDKVDVFKEEGYLIDKPMNLRSIIGGTEGSLLQKFNGEYLFDKFGIILKNKRGEDRGITIRYGKNMTELEQEVDGNSVFTAVFPFYSKSYSESHTSTARIFQPAYIVPNTTELRYDWLSAKLLDPNNGIGGIPIIQEVDFTRVLVEGINHVVEKYTPIRVKTPGDYFNKIYVFKKNNDNINDGPITRINVYRSSFYIDQDENDENNDKEIITGIKLNPEDTFDIIPKFGIIYVIKTEDSKLYNRRVILDPINFYVEYDADGFYVEAKDASGPEYVEEMALPIILPTYPISFHLDTSSWVKDYEDGSIYVRPFFPNVGTVTVDKYVYLDLLNFNDTPVKDPESDFILENGVMYLNQELKNIQYQKVLTLDMTEDLDNIDGLEPTQLTKTHLFNKVEQYLKDNDFTKIKDSITVSFIKLSDSPEYEQFKDLEIVELGDEINVIYENLGVNSKHRVISTEYNVLTNSYNEIELGDKTSKITNNVVSVGDRVSTLKNDSDYTNKEYVVDFFAENADFINVTIQNAIIDTLETANVNISGLLKSSAATIDSLVANMLTSDTAKIKELLEAGSIRVHGKIVALSGDIGGCKIENGELKITTSISINDKFIVNEHGNVLASSFKINTTNEASGIDIADKFRVFGDGFTDIVDAKIDNLKSDKIKMDETGTIQINDAIINYIFDINDMTTQTVDFVSTYVGEYKTLLDVTTFTFTIKSQILGVDKPVWKDTYVRVDASYIDPNTGDVMYINSTCKIVETTSQGQVVLGVMGEIDLILNTVTLSPGSETQTKITTTNPTIGFGSNIFPIVSGLYDLGSANYEWRDIYCVTLTQSSDRRKKKDIDYDISIYEDLFDKLEPASYKFIKDKKNYTHLGFISQDIGQALSDLGLTEKDFAGYVKTIKSSSKDKEKLTEDDYVYGIGYSELHALEVYQIQKLKEYINKLEKRIELLEEKLGTLS